jgi:hypothetical protein
VKSAIVLTSIYDCSQILAGYLENIAKYGHEVDIFLIVDKKTPQQQIPSSIKAPSFEEQDQFLKKIGFRPEDVPWNSDNRRNVGYLMALANGADVIVSLDDDNYCQAEDFIGSHIDALFAESQMTISVEGGWYNNCNLLRPTAYKIYPRGFPYYARNYESPMYAVRQETSIVRINAGMWAGDPDLDAITWLTRPYHSNSAFGSVSLAADTWCPINSQNTAITRDMMVAYWFILMKPPMDRFGDIFQGYFALKVAKHLGWTVRFGTPIVKHVRNSHVYMKDIAKEIGPILLIEELLPKLMEVRLTGTTVIEAYVSLAEFIASHGGELYTEMARLMKQWAGTCRRLEHG